jgi:hypothetical protein
MLQARGLPHAHILIILEVKILCSRQIDKLICAEIPNPATHPQLHAIVKKCMIHKPCDCNAAAGCRLKGKNGSCLRRFPKSLQAQTTASGEGYPKYRRRALHSCIIGDRIVTDDWVVPYNPLLLMLFNCHINIERYLRTDVALSTCTNTFSRYHMFTIAASINRNDSNRRPIMLSWN